MKEGISSVCNKTRGLNEACDENMKCAWNLVCSLEKCIHKGSKKNGDDAKSLEECESFYIKENKCAKGPVFIKKVLVNDEYRCFYKEDKEFDTEARCGKNSKGEKHCNLGRGDVDMSPVNFKFNY
jgi:hypothetical protein